LRLLFESGLVQFFMRGAAEEFIPNTSSEWTFHRCLELNGISRVNTISQRIQLDNVKITFPMLAILHAAIAIVWFFNRFVYRRFVRLAKSQSSLLKLRAILTDLEKGVHIS
jgi:hypothetical protein